MSSWTCEDGISMLMKGLLCIPRPDCVGRPGTLACVRTPRLTQAAECCDEAAANPIRFIPHVFDELLRASEHGTVCCPCVPPSTALFPTRACL